MRGWTIVAWLAACGDNAGVPVDAAADAVLPSVCEGTGASARAECPTQDASACVRPAGVTWLDVETGDAPVTAALPAGVFVDDPAIGCFWAVVREVDGSFEVETSAHGCGWALGLPSGFACEPCGTCRARFEGCEAVDLTTEGCLNDGRIVAASGGLRLRIDEAARTLTVRAPVFDTSSAPSSCATCP